MKRQPRIKFMVYLLLVTVTTTSAMAQDNGNAVPYPPSSDSEPKAEKKVPRPGSTQAPTLPQTGPARMLDPQEKEPLDDDQAWQDISMLTKGSLKVCEVAVLPLVLVPGVGEFLDWICIVPAVMTLNHYGVKHARRSSFYWEPVVALVVAKLIRDAMFYAYLVAAVGSVILYSTGAIAVLAFTATPWLWPVGAAGLLAVIGGTYLVYSDFKDDLFYWLTSGIYLLMAPPIPKGEDSWADVVEIFDPPVSGILRPWSLLVAASGGRAKGRLAHAIPLVGPFIKGEDRAIRVRGEMQRVGDEVLADSANDPKALHDSIDFWTTSEAAVTATSQAFLIAGGALALSGLAFAVHANYLLDQGEDPGQSALVAGGLGTMGMVSAGVGIGLAVFRKAPSALLAVMAGWHFGYPGPDEEGAEEP
jgi:hypothetical protein